MVWHALQEAVNRVESMTCKGCGHDPFMMWLVQLFVYPWMMEAPMDQVYEEIRKEDEKRKLNIVVGREWCVRQGIVKLGKSSNLGEEHGNGENCHQRNGGHGALHLE